MNTILRNIKWGRNSIKIGYNFIDKLLIFFNVILYLNIKKKLKTNKSSLWRLKFPVYIKYNNKKVKVNFFYELVFFSGNADEKKFIDILLNPKYSKLLDLGLNVGRVSYCFLKFNSNAKKAVGFDANPNNINLVNNFILKNNFLKNRLKAINLGVSDKKDKLLFYYNDENDGCGSFIKSNTKFKQEIDVVNIDSYFKKDKFDFDLVKIDVEGFELNVLKGMKIILKKNKIDILIEMWDLKKYKDVDSYLKSLKLDYEITKLGSIDYLIKIK